MSDGPFWAAYVSAFRRDNRMTQEQLAEKLNVSSQTISRWEAGRQTPDLVSQKTLRGVIKPSAQGSTAYWKDRVDNTHGFEILVDRNEAILAISDKVRAYWRYPRDEYLDRRVGSFLPGGAGDGGRELSRFGVKSLGEIGLFTGSVAQVFLVVDYVLNGRGQSRAYDIWPVLTSDDVAAAHFVGHAVDTPNGLPPGDGFTIRTCEVRLPGERLACVETKT